MIEIFLSITKSQKNGRYFILYIKEDNGFIACNKIEKLTKENLVLYFTSGRNAGERQVYKKIKH